MSATKTPVVTSAEELRAQLAKPSPEIAWARAREVFGNEEKAKSWMNRPRPIFDGKSPREMVDSGDPEQVRRVLGTLIQIEFGIYS